MVQMIENRLKMKAREREKARYQRRSPGAFTLLLLSSGGMLEIEMQDAWRQWAKKDLRLGIVHPDRIQSARLYGCRTLGSNGQRRIFAQVSCILIEYRAHACMWVTWPTSEGSYPFGP